VIVVVVVVRGVPVAVVDVVDVIAMRQVVHGLAVDPPGQRGVQPDEIF
jgi:hypothetical protein